MKLGGYTFDFNPSGTDGLLNPRRSVATIKTYKGVAVFSWGVLMAGVERVLEWRFMPTAQFTQLDNLYQADAAVVFDPEDGSGRTFNVELLALEGRYHLNLADAADNYRKQVRLRMVIISEVGV